VTLDPELPLRKCGEEARTAFFSNMLAARNSILDAPDLAPLVMDLFEARARRPSHRIEDPSLGSLNTQQAVCILIGRQVIEGDQMLVVTSDLAPFLVECVVIAELIAASVNKHIDGLKSIAPPQGIGDAVVIAKDSLICQLGKPTLPFGQLIEGGCQIMMWHAVLAEPAFGRNFNFDKYWRYSGAINREPHEIRPTCLKAAEHRLSKDGMRSRKVPRSACTGRNECARNQTRVVLKEVLKNTLVVLARGGQRTP
jgi:hypothetical protein